MAKTATQGGLIKSILLSFDFSSSKTWEWASIMMFWGKIDFFRFLLEKSPEISQKQQKIDFFLKIGTHFHVFDDEKSNESNPDLIRPPCVAVLVFLAILEQLQLSKLLNHRNNHLSRVTEFIPGAQKLAQSMN